MATRGPYNAKAVRIGQLLLADLRRGRFPVGSFLPAEQRLAAEWDAARETVRRAIGLLEQQRLVTRVPHRGVLVSGSPEAAVQLARRTRTIAIVLASEPDDGMSLIQSGVCDYARERGYAVRSIITPEDPERAFQVLDRGEARGLDGAIVLPYPGREHRELLERLWPRGLPVVCIERRSSALKVPSVEIDNAAGMYRAVRHLLITHRRPVWYLGMTPGHQNDRDRYEGYRLAMRDAGYAEQIDARTVLHPWSTDDPRYWHVTDAWAQGHEVAQQLFARDERFWSVACQKDDIAWGLYRACAERGLTIGRQVAVTGFDDHAYAARLDPPLTTVRQPFRDKGYQAARLLDRVLGEGMTAAVQVTLGVELVVRGSA